MDQTLLRKEFLEQRRTHKLLILAAVLLVSGLISPILAYYTPALLRAIPELPAAFSALIPEPTVRDAIGQYLKNMSQFGVLLVIILTMGMMAQEKERGTAALVLTKPVRRSALVLTKWLAGIGTLAISVIVAAIGAAIYTAILFQPLPLPGFLALNLLLGLFLTVYLTLALLASTLARSQAIAAAIAFGFLVLMLILSGIPGLNAYMPNQLLNWGAALILGEDLSAWPALFVSIAIIAAALGLAILRFQNEEI